MKVLARSLVLSLATLLLPALAAAETIGFATLPPGAINNVQAQVIAKIVQANSDLQVRVTPYRGGGAMTAAVNAKQAEFGITDIIELTDAYSGNDRFEGKAMPNLRVAFRVLAFPIGIFVRKDSEIKSLADMKGKRFATEWSAFPNSILMANAILSTVGLSLADVDGVPTANIIRGAEDFKSGKTDGFIFAVGAPKVAEVNSAVGGIRVLPIEDTPKNHEAMKKVRPDYFMMKVPPLPNYAGVSEPTNVLGTDLTIFVGAHVPDDVVYEFVKAVRPEKKALVQGHPSFNGFDPDQMAKQFTAAKYHPGAIKYFKEVGIWPGS